MDRVFRPFRLQPPLVVPKLNRLFLRAYRDDRHSGCRTHSAGFRTTSLGLRLSPAGSPRRQAESSSSSSGLVVHLPILSTSRRREAASFGYRTRFRPDGDSQPAGSIHSQTHWRTPPGVRIRPVVHSRAFASLEACATERPASHESLPPLGLSCVWPPAPRTSSRWCRRAAGGGCGRGPHRSAAPAARRRPAGHRRSRGAAGRVPRGVGRPAR